MKNIYDGTILKSYTVAVGFLIFISIALPSNYFFNIPVKFLAIAVAAALLAIASATHKISRKSVIYLTVSLALCGTWTLIGVYNGYPTSSVLGEASSVLALILTLFLTFALTNNQNERKIAVVILRSAFYGSLAFLIIKLIIFVAIFFIPGFLLMSVDALNYKPVGLAIATGGSRLSYINSDFATLCIVTIAYILRADLDLNNRPIWLITFALLAVSLYSAYSRSLFVFAFLFIILYFFFYSNSKKIGRFLAIVGATLLIGFLIQYFYSEIMTIIEQRFIDQFESDSQRTVMINKIFAHWSEKFILGWGLGAYVPDYIRSTAAPYSYEVQLLSIFMKTGLFGIILIITLSASYIKKCLNKSKPSTFLAMVYLILIANSMTNQYLLSATTTVLLVVLWHSLSLCPQRFNRNKEYG